MELVSLFPPITRKNTVRPTHPHRGFSKGESPTPSLALTSCHLLFLHYLLPILTDAVGRFQLSVPLSPQAKENRFHSLSVLLPIFFWANRITSQSKHTHLQYSKVIKSTDLQVRLPGFKSQLCLLPVVWCEVSHLTSLCLSVLVYKIVIINNTSGINNTAMLFNIASRSSLSLTWSVSLLLGPVPTFTLKSSCFHFLLLNDSWAPPISLWLRLQGKNREFLLPYSGEHF